MKDDLKYMQDLIQDMLSEIEDSEDFDDDKRFELTAVLDEIESNVEDALRILKR